jgi:hypothetical protein
MRIRRRRSFTAVVTSLLVATIPQAALAAAPPQGATAIAPAGARSGGWELTGHMGTGLSFYFGDQAADPMFGFSAGRFLSDSLQIDFQLLGMPGAVRERFREEYRSVDEGNGQELLSTSLSRVRRQMYLALTRWNIHFGEARARPYLSFGAGLGWGSERYTYESSCVSPQCPAWFDSDDLDEDQGLGFATLLGTGVDVALSDRWRLRPEVIMPVLWVAPQPGYVTLAVGVTYTTRTSATTGGTPATPSRPRAGEPLSSAWRRVAALPLGDPIRVRVRRGTEIVREGDVEIPDSRTLIGSFVAADERALMIRVTEGPVDGTWRIPRARIERIERGRIDNDGPWEGVLGGFVGGSLAGALMYLGSGGGDDHEILLPAGTVLFGGPAALIGGISDHLHHSFEVAELTYDIRLVVPGD